MGKITEDYEANFNAIAATTKGSAPGNHILWSAILLTVFETVESWVFPNPVKRMQGPPNEPRQ